MIWKIAVIAAVTVSWLYELSLHLLSMRSKNCVQANCMNGIIAEDVEFNINVN